MEWLVDGLEWAVARWALAEEIRALLMLDGARGERQLHHVEHKATALEALAMAQQVIGTPIVRVAGRIGIDVAHAELGELAIFVVGRDGVLGADIHGFVLPYAPLELRLDRFRADH